MFKSASYVFQGTTAGLAAKQYESSFGVLQTWCPTPAGGPNRMYSVRNDWGCAGSSRVCSCSTVWSSDRRAQGLSTRHDQQSTSCTCPVSVFVTCRYKGCQICHSQASGTLQSCGATYKAVQSLACQNCPHGKEPFSSRSLG